MAGDPQTFEELKLAIEGWLARDDQAERIPEYIALAERRFNRNGFSTEREGSSTLTAAASVALPSDFWGVKALWLDTDPKVVLDPMTLVELRQHYSSAATGQPGNYAISGANIVLGPAPDSAYSMPLAYWKTSPALGAAVADNWLLLAHPDLYLAASLVEGFLWARDESRAQIWDQRTQAKIDEVNGAGQRKQHGRPPRIRSSVVV
jgi:hypothetical protein